MSELETREILLWMSIADVKMMIKWPGEHLDRQLFSLWTSAAEFPPGGKLRTYHCEQIDRRKVKTRKFLLWTSATGFRGLLVSCVAEVAHPRYHICREDSQGQRQRAREWLVGAGMMACSKCSKWLIYTAAFKPEDPTSEPRGSIHMEFYKGSSMKTLSAGS